MAGHPRAEISLQGAAVDLQASFRPAFSAFAPPAAAQVLARRAKLRNKLDNIICSAGLKGNAAKPTLAKHRAPAQRKTASCSRPPLPVKPPPAGIADRGLSAAC